MYAAPLKACEWDYTHVVEMLSMLQVLILFYFFTLLIKTKFICDCI